MDRVSERNKEVVSSGLRVADNFQQVLDVGPRGTHLIEAGLPFFQSPGLKNLFQNIEQSNIVLCTRSGWLESGVVFQVFALYSFTEL